MIERNNNRKTYESSKGFRIEESVTVPITQGKNIYLEDDKPYLHQNQYKARVETFSESSTLTNDVAKNLIIDKWNKDIVQYASRLAPPDVYTKDPLEQANIVSKSDPTRIP